MGEEQLGWSAGSWSSTPPDARPASATGWWTAADRSGDRRGAAMAVAVLGVVCAGGAVVLAATQEDPFNRWAIGGGLLAILTYLAVFAVSQLRGSPGFGAMSVRIDPVGYDQGSTAVLQVHQPLTGVPSQEPSVTAEVLLHVLEWRTWRDPHTRAPVDGYVGEVVDRRPAAVQQRFDGAAVHAEVHLPTPILPASEQRNGYPTESHATLSITVRMGRATTTELLDLPLRGAPPSSVSSTGTPGFGWTPAPTPAGA